MEPLRYSSAGLTLISFFVVISLRIKKVRFG